MTGFPDMQKTRIDKCLFNITIRKISTVSGKYRYVYFQHNCFIIV